VVAELVARGKGAPTIQAVVRLLHRVFEVALEEERIAESPADVYQTGILIAASPDQSQWTDWFYAVSSDYINSAGSTASHSGFCVARVSGGGAGPFPEKPA
jgi:hypothetical protein